MIPPLDADSGNLPPGVRDAPWNEIVARYGSTPHRPWLLAGLKAALDVLREAGCRRAYLDGSFVTATEVPHDFDACWELAGVDFDLLDRSSLSCLIGVIGAPPSRRGSGASCSLQSQRRIRGARHTSSSSNGTGLPVNRRASVRST